MFHLILAKAIQRKIHLIFHSALPSKYEIITLLRPKNIVFVAEVAAPGSIPKGSAIQPWIFHFPQIKWARANLSHWSVSPSRNFPRVCRYRRRKKAGRRDKSLPPALLLLPAAYSRSNYDTRNKGLWVWKESKKCGTGRFNLDATDTRKIENYNEQGLGRVDFRFSFFFLSMRQFWPCTVKFASFPNASFRSSGELILLTIPFQLFRTGIWLELEMYHLLSGFFHEKRTLV